MTASPSSPDWLQRWLAVLVAVTILALLQLHLWPKRPEASRPDWRPLPGTMLPPFPGSSSPESSLSPTVRRQLPQAMELRLTTLVSRRSADLQVASLTRETPFLSLKQRHLVGDQVAVGLLAQRSALQTCVIGSGHAVTAQGLHDLKPHNPANASLLLRRWLGMSPQPESTCLLVTLVQAGKLPQGTALSTASMLNELQAFLEAH